MEHEEEEEESDLERSGSLGPFLVRVGVCHSSVKYGLADVATPIKDSIRVELAGKAQGTSQDSIYFSLVVEPHKVTTRAILRSRWTKTDAGRQRRQGARRQAT